LAINQALERDGQLFPNQRTSLGKGRSAGKGMSCHQDRFQCIPDRYRVAEPAAHAPAVVGVVSLHDFRPWPQYSTSTEGSSGSIFQIMNTGYFVEPTDLATVYNFNPVFTEGRYPRAA
jgi:hypothetical protein